MYYSIVLLDAGHTWLLKRVSSNCVNMKPKTDRAISRTQKPKFVEGEGLNWVIIAGGALLSTLSFRLVCKLKQAVTKNLPTSDSNGSKGLIMRTCSSLLIQ